MRKLIVVSLFFVFCFVPLMVMAEHSAIDKGSIELGVGNVAELSFYRGDNILNGYWFTVGWPPGVTFGYFVIDRLMLGATLTVFSDKYETMTEADTELDVMPIVKYYYPISEKFLINAKGYFGLYRYKDSSDPDNPFTRVRFGGGGAGTYMLIPQLGASIGMDFTYYSDYKVGGTKADDTSYVILGIILGLVVYL